MEDVNRGRVQGEQQHTGKKRLRNRHGPFKLRQNTMKQEAEARNTCRDDQCPKPCVVVELSDESGRVTQRACGMVEKLQQERTPEHEETVIGLALKSNDVAVYPVEYENGSSENCYQSDVQRGVLTHHKDPGNWRYEGRFLDPALAA